MLPSCCEVFIKKRGSHFYSTSRNIGGERGTTGFSNLENVKKFLIHSVNKSNTFTILLKSFPLNMVWINLMYF
jgi:hypothetical protein